MLMTEGFLRLTIAAPLTLTAELRDKVRAEMSDMTTHNWLTQHHFNPRLFRAVLAANIARNAGPQLEWREDLLCLK